MSRSLSVLFVLAAGLCACAQPTAPGYAWSYQQDEHEGAKLAYGAPSSDDVVLMMTCAPGSGRVLLSAISEGSRNDIVLASAGGRDRFTGATAPSELGGALVEAEAPASARALDGFARTGDLAMMAGGEQVSLAAGHGEREGVAEFFEICRT